MAGNVYPMEQDVLMMVDDIIRQYLPELLKIQDPCTMANAQSKIAFIFTEKASKQGGRPVLAKTSKVSPKVRPLLTNPETEFIVEVAYDTWRELSLHQQQALLFHELSRFNISEDAESGEMKVVLRPPDISYFFRELEIFGHWRPNIIDEEGGPVPPSQFPEEVERILLGKDCVSTQDSSEDSSDDEDLL